MFDTMKMKQILTEIVICLVPFPGIWIGKGVKIPWPYRISFLGCWAWELPTAIPITLVQRATEGRH